MKTKEELLKDRQDIIDTMDIMPEQYKKPLQKQLDEINEQIREIEEKEQTAMPETAPVPTAPVPTAPVSTAPVPQDIPQTGELDVDKTLATILTLMQSSPEGSGMDSKMVTDLINSVLATSVIKLEQLDKKVLEEIKRNQTIELKIPQYGDVTIKVTKDDTDIPYFYEILDDVLAGNNVYLIGEAGAGKTYGAEQIAGKLEREIVMINCSQYTSPTEIVGGQTINGYKVGKLIDAWDKGKMLILDEMPRLDPNTAGLFNDALSKSSKTRPKSNARITSTNPEDKPFERSDKFCLIATGNVYPNTKPPEKYKANFQQDLSLLDRFSGSVYSVEYVDNLDQKQCRYQFLYDMLIGNYYEYIKAVKDGTTKPTATGLRTIIKDLSQEELAVVSYRTVVSFRIAFEFELVRELERRKNPKKEIPAVGKTLYKAFESYLVAFNQDAKRTIIRNTGFTQTYVEKKVKSVIDKIANGGISDTLTPALKDNVKGIIQTYDDLFVPIVNK